MLRSATRLWHPGPSTGLPPSSTVDSPARLAAGGSSANVAGRVRRESGGPRGGRPSDGLPFLGRVGGCCSGARGRPTCCVFPHSSWGVCLRLPSAPQLIALPEYSPARPSFDPAALPVFFPSSGSGYLQLPFCCRSFLVLGPSVYLSTCYLHT